MPPPPSRAEHTLPVTSVLLGLGEVNAIAVTASLDRTAKIWQLATGKLLRAAALPAGATAAALDAGEHALYVGCADGSICEVALAGAAAAQGGGAAATTAAGAAAAPAAGDVVVMEGHSKPVSSLAISLDGDSLVSGSEDGSVRVWDLRSRQCVRVIASPARAPVTAALVVEWPDYLAGVGQGTAGGGGRHGPKRPAPLAPLAKFRSGAGGGGGSGGAAGAQAWEGSPVVLDGSCPAIGVAELPGLLLPRGAPLLAEAAGFGALIGDSGYDVSNNGTFGQAAAAGAAAGGGGVVAEEGGLDAARRQVAELQQRLAEAEAEADRWKELHSELHAFCTEQALGGAKV
jgi:pre-rRNA-processing protein IPI3